MKKNRQNTDEKKIFVKHVSDKEQVSKIYLECLKLKHNKQPN